MTAGRINGPALLALTDDDFARFEETYYSVSDDTCDLQAGIRRINEGVSAGSLRSSAATIHKAAAAACAATTSTRTCTNQRVTNPEWLTQAAPKQVASEFKKHGKVDGTFILVGHPNACQFSLFFSWKGKVETRSIHRKNPGSFFTLGAEQVCDNRTLQGFVLFLQSDSDANPLPCELKKALPCGGGEVAEMVALNHTTEL